MNILFFIEGRSVPASRYRALQFGPTLQQQGHRVRWAVSWPEKYSPHTNSPLVFALALGAKMLVRLSQLVWLPWADIVVIQRELTPYGIGALERFVFRWHKRVVFDFDDALELTYRDRRPGLGWLSSEKNFEKTLRRAQLVIAGNEQLAGTARQFNSKTIIIPTVIDAERYSPGLPRSQLTIGWIGTVGNAQNLALVLPALQRLRDEKIPFEFRVISDHPPTEILRAFPEAVFVRWSAENEVAEFRGFSIGLMPLEDTAWNKGKCGFKLIQYMSVGLATVSSPVGVNATIVANETAGLLARTPDEWYTTLKRLMGDAALRQELGKNARQRIVAEYSLTRWAPILASSLDSVAAVGQVVTRP